MAGAVRRAFIGALAVVLTTMGAAVPAAERLAGLATEPAAGELRLAWLDANGEVHTATLDPEGRPTAPQGQPVARGEPLAMPRSGWTADDAVPLGSLWKLVAHAQLTRTGAQEPPYTCRGGNREEAYCCEPGQRVHRAAALWRSCGLYFAPARLKLATRSDASAATSVWQALPVSMQALSNPANWRSETTVSLRDWLRWLGDWPAATQQAARADLLGYWLQGPGQGVLGDVGSRLRVKTFTVEAADGARWGGASGWTSDGTPLWLAARGGSARVLPEHAAQVLAFLDAQRDDGVPLSNPVPSVAAPCIDVDFFARYPVAAISPQPLREGRLPAGAYRLRFVNGQSLDIRSADDLSWRRTDVGANAKGERLQVTGRFTLDDYVARVIDSEGAGDPSAAARALAVAARTYVLQRARPEAGCLRIADSSATQRVSPRPPSAAAVAAARHTADLVLHGADGRFHSTQARPGVMSWSDTVQAARSGEPFDRLVRTAYGPSSGLRGLGTARGTGLASAGAASDCDPLPLAAQWLQRQQPVWRRQLQADAGYRTPASVQVCRLQQGHPHALRTVGRIYASGVSGVHSLEERLTLTHEYLHLAFASHPRGGNEAFIERRARQLLGVDE